MSQLKSLTCKVTDGVGFSLTPVTPGVKLDARCRCSSVSRILHTETPVELCLR